MPKEPKTLDEQRETIRKELGGYDGRLKGMYSSSIIAFALRATSARYGVDAANGLIREFHLTKYGWREQFGEESESETGVDPRDMIDPLQRIENEG